ncbi:MAG TPA: radical SAM protein [bacterium]|nr:radical SAM protein [bacterium]HQJ60188.1 radical SAM protein [bacterium]
MDMILFMTRECTLKCHYCYVEHKYDSFMSRDVALKAADLFVKENSERAKFSFFGGEPLLQFELIKEITEYVVKIADKKGFAPHLSIATNGTLINEEVLDFFEKYKFRVELSLDGDEFSHNLNRPMRDGGNSYRSVVRNLAALKKRAGHLAVVGVITPLTSAHIAENAKHVMDELNINSYIMAADYTAPWTEDDLSKVIEQFLILEEWYLAKSRNGDSFYFSAFDAHIAAHIKGGFKPGDFCDVGRKICAVGEDGRIFPCVRFAGKPERAANYVLGDVNSGFDWKKCSEVSTENHSPRTQCSDCSLDGRCITYCPCLNWDTTGSMTQVPGILCAFESMVIPVADRIARTLFKEKNRSFMKKHY